MEGSTSNKHIYIDDSFKNSISALLFCFQKANKKLIKAVAKSIGFLMYAACGVSGMITKCLFGIFSIAFEIDALSSLP